MKLILVFLSGVLSAQTAVAGVNYFGYYGSAMNGLPYDATSQVAGISNTVFIRGASTAEVLAKLAEANSHGMAAIVDVQNVLFPWNSSLVCLASTCPIDYATAFLNFHNAIKSYDYMIAAYYIFDEPYWNNYLASIGQLSGWNYTDNSSFYWQLWSAINVVHTYAPGKPTAIIFSYAEMQGMGSSFQWYIPTNLDWMGFDGYIATGCSDACVQNNFSYLVNVSNRTGQKLIAVIDSYWNSPPTPKIQNQIVTRINLWKQLIAANGNQTIAILPFLYQSDVSQSLYAADEMPLVKSALTSYYHELHGP